MRRACCLVNRWKSVVEKEYSEIFTGEALKKVLGKRFAEVDGYLYVSYGGATGWGVTNIKVSGVSKSNNEIEYIVTYNDVEIALEIAIALIMGS